MSSGMLSISVFILLYANIQITVDPFEHLWESLKKGNEQNISRYSAQCADLLSTTPSTFSPPSRPTSILQKIVTLLGFAHLSSS